MECIKLFWENAPKGEPTIILYEVDVDNQRLALRSIDVFVDGPRPLRRCYRGHSDSNRRSIQQPCLGRRVPRLHKR